MTEDQERFAADVLRAAEFMPGVTRVVALNTLMHYGAEPCLTYLLGVGDTLSAVGHPQSRAFDETRRRLREALRAGVAS